MFRLRFAYNTPDPSDSSSFYEDPSYQAEGFDPEKLVIESMPDERYISYGDNEVAVIGYPSPEDIKTFNIREPERLHAFLMLGSQEALPLDTDKPLDSVKDSELLDLLEKSLVKEYHVLDFGDWLMDNLSEE